MNTSWLEEYSALTEYVSQKPDIKISPNSLRIPKAERETFYARIDDVIQKLSAELAGGHLVELKTLIDRIQIVRQQIYTGSNLKLYKLPTSLENLIADSEQEISRPLFELVLDTLQNKRSPEDMEDRAAQLIFPFLKDLQRSAYEIWAYLSIIEAWKPVRFYGIVTDFKTLVVSDTDEVIVGNQPSSPDKRLPEALFETADGQTIAVKMETGLELDYYGEKVSREKGYSSGGNTVNELAHRVLLVYRFPSPQEVGFIADAAENYVRPTNLTCTFLLPSEMENEYLFSSFVRHIRMVRSLRPVQLLSFDANGHFPAEWANDPRVPKWERTITAYDLEQLKQVASRL